MSTRPVNPAAPHPCAACPWRTENHGKPHPDGWYTKANRARLWKQLRRGESMTCHPTDPSNPLPEGAATVPTEAQTLECAGALILQQREMMRFQSVCRAVDAGEGKKGSGLKIYRQCRPKGMTRDGLLALVERSMFSGTALGGAKMSRPDLAADVSQDGVEPWGPADETPHWASQP